MYTFPNIATFEDVLPAIEGADEFIVKRDNTSGIMVVNYLFAATETFPNPLEAVDENAARLAAIRRECRGLKFDIQTGAVVTRPYHKFFNVGEKPETQPHLIDWSEPHHILEKLDGSLITHHRRPDGGSEWHTKMGHTEVAVPVERFVATSPLPYEAFANDLRASGKTAIFEWCSRQQKIVLDYPEDRLILTAIRDTYTGTYMDYTLMRILAESRDIPVVRALPGTVDNIQQFMDETRDAEGIEGYVIRFADGRHYKVKGQWYVQIHGTKDELAREKNVWEILLHDRLDDLKPFMDPADLVAAEAFAQAFDAAVARHAQGLVARVAEAKARLGDDKKAFAFEIAKEVQDKGMLFSIWDDKNPVEVVRSFLRKNVGSMPKIEAVRSIIGGLSWDRYYKPAPLED